MGLQTSFLAHHRLQTSEPSLEEDETLGLAKNNNFTGLCGYYLLSFPAEGSFARQSGRIDTYVSIRQKIRVMRCRMMVSSYPCFQVKSKGRKLSGQQSVSDTLLIGSDNVASTVRVHSRETRHQADKIDRREVAKSPDYRANWNSTLNLTVWNATVSSVRLPRAGCVCEAQRRVIYVRHAR